VLCNQIGGPTRTGRKKGSHQKENHQTAHKTRHGILPERSAYGFSVISPTNFSNFPNKTEGIKHEHFKKTGPGNRG
jgi:hypothetical protein